VICDRITPPLPHTVVDCAKCIYYKHDSGSKQGDQGLLLQHKKEVRFIYLPRVWEIYEIEKRPIELFFAFCGLFASYILLKYVTLNEVKPYLSEKSLEFIEKWKGILIKIKDVNTLVQAFEDVKNLYQEFTRRK